MFDSSSSAPQIEKRVLTNGSCMSSMYAVDVDGNSIVAMADSGATCSVMSNQEYQKLKLPKLSQTNASVSVFGDGHVDVLGKFSSTFVVDDIHVHDVMYVCRETVPTVLSSSLSQALGLIIMKPHVTAIFRENISNRVQAYLATHKELHTGIGCLEGYKVKLTVNPKVQPEAQQHRRVPFHMGTKLEEELKMF